jgi:hypothetical protein
VSVLSGDSVEDLFPTHGAIEERQQIGRSDAIAALAARIRDHGDSLLLEPRKEGKSSVAGAAMARIAAEGGIVTEVDCTSAGIGSGESMARAVLQSVRAQDRHVSRALEARNAAAKRRDWLAKLRRGTSAAEAVGVGEAGALGRALDVLPDPDGVTLDDVLDALTRLGEAETVALFLDEVQAVARWADGDEVQRALARFMRRKGRRVAVVVAGSDRSATEALFAPGKPLHWEFEPFPLPPIDRLDWHRGLVERFALAGHELAAGLVDVMLDATGGHPQRTMAVAKQTLREARAAEASEVSWGAVDAAITIARRHPSWST